MRDLMMETAARGTVVGNLADLAVGSRQCGSDVTSNARV